MSFQALTGAPRLCEGVRLNIMATPQRAGAAPERLAAGADVTLRFGHCCPLIREGRILAADAARAVLVLDGDEWTLEQGESGVTIPGIVSEDWFVRSRAA